MEEITVGSTIKGVTPDGMVTVLGVRWIGSLAIELTYKDASGRPGNILLYREDEPQLEVVREGRPWSFDGDGSLFRLVSEARRIRLAYLFDPLLAVHTSLIEPLPHQITAVYGEMLPRQPLRYLLADDPGAGKTIMAGLLIKELMVRGDVQRCLVVCPGNLVEQWQDELYQKFQLPFDIMTNQSFEAARTGNWFRETDLAICRLDKLSRNEDVQAKLRASDWDLVVCDEAHKMSAHYFGGEVSYTKRYRLGQLLSSITRHFLLLTATPHNGKEEDFQLFMALLDGDRFEGRFREGVHTTDASDLMRRMVKEDLVKFDGTPLFPERRAYTVDYTLSDEEYYLYREVTDYVRQEFNRAEALENEGRKGTVGFALTTLQRRLASSPEAIYQSLRRRRERLEKRLREEQVRHRAASARLEWDQSLPDLPPEDQEELDDRPDAEVEATEEEVVDRATAARTIGELEAEIESLRRLEELALKVRQAGVDRKWEELSRLLQEREEMFDAKGHRRKLIVFTEHRDTLSYLERRISSLLGRPEAVLTIHGSMLRKQRKTSEQRFNQDPTVEILVATDAAGEGINLQRAHLMVNYDLPWNPNRLEQRFGRIHRIGQTEVCHLWNLVAKNTREGEVYLRLLEKLEQEREALGGRVFDVLGKLRFEDRPLRDLLIEAIRYGELPEVKERLSRVIDDALDRERLRDLLEERALAHDVMDARAIRSIKEEMERAEARRLQPHYIASFFLEAFRLLGGSVREREPKRYEIRNVPAAIRHRDRMIGTREAVLTRYERITFEKDLISVEGKPPAAFVCPGHPLLEATLDLILERYGELLKRGAVLVDEEDPSEEARLLVILEHSIKDARSLPGGDRRLASRRLQFLELDSSGESKAAGYAPYLDYRPATQEELELLKGTLDALPWAREEIEEKVLLYATEKLIPEHLSEVRRYREELVDKTAQAVKDRLSKEIAYWDGKAQELKEKELAGKHNARLNSGLARRRADELEARLKRRLAELEEERKLYPLPPVIVGGALVIPQGLLLRLKGEEGPTEDREEVEALAMAEVMKVERRLGYLPRDVSAEKKGYDIESLVPDTGKLRFIEVKGRQAGAATVTITRNEILTALNKPDDFILAIVEVDGERVTTYYVDRPFQREPDFGVTSVNYSVSKLLEMGRVMKC
nr:helicase-related protein [Candidatus Solincola tengchongensis]